MASSSFYKVTCECGHVGSIKMKENDALGQWEEYTLQNLNGGRANIKGGTLTWEQVFTQAKPSCPLCSAVLTPANMK